MTAVVTTTVGSLPYPPGLGLTPTGSVRSHSRVTSLASQFTSTSPANVFQSPKSNGVVQNKFMLPIAARSPANSTTISMTSPKSGHSNGYTPTLPISLSNATSTTCTSPASRTNAYTSLTCTSPSSRLNQPLLARTPSQKIEASQKIETKKFRSLAELQASYTVRPEAQDPTNDNGDAPTLVAAARSKSVNHESASISRKWRPQNLDLDGGEVASKVPPVAATMTVVSPQARISPCAYLTGAPQRLSPTSLRSPSAPATQNRTKVSEVIPAVLNPLAIRFSQARINPYFSNGSSLEAAISACKEEPCEIGGSKRSFLRVPFPAIEVVRFAPKLRTEDGAAVKDANGKQAWGEERWFTLDNRRLYCLQQAALKAWPRACCVAVNFCDAVGKYKYNQQQELKKFKTTTEGATINVGRGKDALEDITTWDWQMELTKVAGVDDRLSDLLDSIEAEEKVTKPLQARIAGGTKGQTPVTRQADGAGKFTASQIVTVVSPKAMLTSPKVLQGLQGSLSAAAIPWSPTSAFSSAMPMDQYWTSQYWPSAAAELPLFPDAMAQYPFGQWDLQAPGGLWTGPVAAPAIRSVQATSIRPAKGSAKGKGVTRLPCKVSAGRKGHTPVVLKPR